MKSLPPEMERFTTDSSRASGVMSVLDRVGPLRTVFVASILLSIVAIWGKISPNNDGMLYVEAAQLFQQGGLDAARQVYDWLFLSVLIASTSSLTGLHPETAAYVLGTLFQAALGVVLVDCTRRLYPQASWAAVVVVLALPAFNNYRDFIIREHGAWLFTFVSLWLLILWNERRAWWLVFASQVSVLLAFLFRPETVIFLGVPFLWLVWHIRRPEARRGLIQFATLPALGAIALAILSLSGEVAIAGKLAQQLQAINIAAQADDFRAAAERIGSQLSPLVMGRDAERVLFYGLLSLIVIKFLTNFGLFIVPLYRAVWADRAERPRSPAVAPLVWAAALYGVTLVAFVFDKFFMQARFVAFLNLLAVPVLAWGLWRVWLVWPRWRWLVVVLALVTAIANVVSTSPKKTRYPEAAAWVVEQGIPADRIYFDEPVVSYLADMGYRSHPSNRFRNRSRLAAALQEGRFDLIVLAGRPSDPTLMTWAEENRLRQVAVFTDERNRAVHAFVPLPNAIPND